MNGELKQYHKYIWRIENSCCFAFECQITCLGKSITTQFNFCFIKVNILEIDTQQTFVQFFEAFDNLIEMVTFWPSTNYYTVVQETLCVRPTFVQSIAFWVSAGMSVRP